MRNFRRNLSKLTKKTLVLLLAMVTAVAAVGIIGWSTNSRPMATAWGDVAAWSGVVVTILGVYYAVQSLLAESDRRRDDETARRKANARSISAIGSIHLIQVRPEDVDPSSTTVGEAARPMPPADGEWDYTIEWAVINDSQLPIRDVVIHLPLFGQDGTVTKNAFAPQWVGTVTVNGNTRSGTASTRTRGKPKLEGLVDFTVSFTDAWDTRWDRHADGSLVEKGTLPIPAVGRRYRTLVAGA